MDEDVGMRPAPDVIASEARPAEKADLAARPAGERALGAQAVEFATFAVAIIGALALGLGITDYLGDHLDVLAYLAAYAGFRVAQMLMTPRPGAIVDLVEACSGRLGELPTLLLFCAAPFERTYASGGEAPVWIGAIGLLMGLSGFWLTLGAQIQIARATESAQTSIEGPPLIRTGLFRYIRHPSYAGQWLAWMGWPLIYSAPITAAAMLVGGALVVGQQIREEEGRMLERFGEEYASYKRETDRLIPSLW